MRDFEAGPCNWKPEDAVEPRTMTLEIDLRVSQIEYSFEGHKAFVKVTHFPGVAPREVPRIVSEREVLASWNTKEWTDDWRAYIGSRSNCLWVLMNQAGVTFWLTDCARAHSLSVSDDAAFCCFCGRQRT